MVQKRSENFLLNDTKNDFFPTGSVILTWNTITSFLFRWTVFRGSDVVCVGGGTNHRVHAKLRTTTSSRPSQIKAWRHVSGHSRIFCGMWWIIRSDVPESCFVLSSLRRPRHVEMNTLLKGWKCMYRSRQVCCYLNIGYEIQFYKFRTIFRKHCHIFPTGAISFKSDASVLIQVVICGTLTFLGINQHSRTIWVFIPVKTNLPLKF
jgi:hypothetical protein